MESLHFGSDPKPIKVPNSSFQILMVFSNSASIIKRLNIPVLSWNLNCLFDHFDTINTRDSSRLPTPITSLHSQWWSVFPFFHLSSSTILTIRKRKLNKYNEKRTQKVQESTHNKSAIILKCVMVSIFVLE